ncbi:ribosome maturation factor RimM [Frigoribacterium sp. PhB116]|uniref:ribosome maturation factor RimM n=1 Tax=Frigoribacterium sp. PhB116 TaxID=2485174 RepID=UPI0010EFBD9B|nr:ribosome maturation factor RimM [Frigoribacterium sp. PhB116]TDT65958.1 16S rRNA processing protein RimM [Frigoribacterium sp. PhB116]
MAPTDKTQLRVGRLTKAHGLKGALKLELFTDTPEQRFTPGASFTLQVPETSEWSGKTLTLGELRWYNGHPVGFFEGVDDRTAAESLVKAILWVDQDLDELPDEDDAWYHHQLVGLRVERDGVVVGTVARVDHLPAQDLLAVETEHGEVLVPFVNALVPSVDIEAGVVTVTPPPGLFEELADDTADADTAEADTADGGTTEADTADGGTTDGGTEAEAEAEPASSEADDAARPADEN